MASVREAIIRKLNRRLGNVPTDLTDDEKDAFKQNSGTEDFHLHDDVNAAPGLENIDRVLISDESEQDNPNAHTTLGVLKTFFRFVLGTDVATELTSPADNDRLLVTDVSANGTPNRWARVDRIKSIFTRTEAAMPTAANARRDALYRVVDSDDKVMAIRIKSNRNTPFFAVTVANLGSGQRGFATSGFTGINSGGTSGYSALGAFFERFSTLASSVFTRVGTYTVSGNPKGLAGSGTTLYYPYDDGSGTRIRGFNPETGAQTYESGKNFSADAPVGLAIVGNNAFFNDDQDNDIYRCDITQTNAPVRLAQGHSGSTRGLASDGTNLYLIDSSRTVYPVNQTTGQLGTGQMLTGFNSLDGQAVAAFTYFNGNFYIGTSAIGGTPYLYTVNVSNGQLTEVGPISPDNAAFEHYGSLGDAVYAFSGREIYKSGGGSGNQWVVYFPLTTTEVDGSDVSLTLETSDGATPILLERDTSITDGIVFASGLDGADAHTISVNQTLNPALYKADGTQLYEGALGAIYEEVHGTPKFTTRGALIATSSTLPTAADGNELTTITWTLGSDLPSGFGASGSRIRVPQLKPSQQVNGFEAVALLDGVEVDQANFGWGPESIDVTSTSEERNIATLSFGVEDRIDMRYNQDDDDAFTEIYLWGNSDILPSNATIKAYLSGVFAQ